MNTFTDNRTIQFDFSIEFHGDDIRLRAAGPNIQRHRLDEHRFAVKLDNADKSAKVCIGEPASAAGLRVRSSHEQGDWVEWPTNTTGAQSLPLPDGKVEVEVEVIGADGGTTQATSIIIVRSPDKPDPFAADYVDAEPEAES